MKISDLAEAMMEMEAGKDPVAVAYLDKLLLRIFENPAYMNYLSAYQYLPSQDVIELVFYRLPDDVMDEIKLIVSRDAEFKQFDDEHGRPMIGVIIPSNVWKEEREQDLNISTKPVERSIDNEDVDVIS